jgi:23S rRNA-/tRNA-specific pseudouridylate synthase
MAVAERKSAIRGRAIPARTDWKLVETKPPFSLLDVSIAKGARHQIRVHLAASGFPIVGDKLYNKNASRTAAQNHLLYCYRVHLTCMNGKEKAVETEVPFRKNWKLIVA